MNWICDLFGSTTFLTVISGTFVFIFGQLFMELILKPIRRYNEIRAKAAYHLTYYANAYHKDSTQEPFRELAAELDSYLIQKPKWLFWINKANIGIASSMFIRLSNSVSSTPPYGRINEDIEAIKKSLNLRRK